MIISHFGSYICYNTQELIHQNICEAEETPYITALPHDMAAFGYETVSIEKNFIAFKKDDKFLSANPNGYFQHQPYTGQWERFRVCDEPRLLFAPKFQRSFEIPKIIHQTERYDTISKPYRENVTALREMNKDYTYRYYSDKDCHDFIYEFYGWNILERFLRINPRYGAARADLFRYLCVYKYGGIYLDIKSGLERPLSEILRPDDELVVAQWKSVIPSFMNEWGRGPMVSNIEGGEYVNWFIIAAAGHPLLKKAIDQVLANILLYDQNMHGTGMPATLEITGPQAFTRAIFPHFQDYPHRQIDAAYEGLVYQKVQQYTRSSNYRAEELPLIL